MYKIKEISLGGKKYNAIILLNSTSTFSKTAVTSTSIRWSLARVDAENKVNPQDVLNCAAIKLTTEETPAVVIGDNIIDIVIAKHNAENSTHLELETA
jgi:hypothetical protein